MDDELTVPPSAGNEVGTHDVAGPVPGNSVSDARNPGTGMTAPARVDLTPSDLTLADLEQVVTIVAARLRSLSQVESVLSVRDLPTVQFPVGSASARQLWEAVFAAALDEPREALILLLHNICDHLGTLSKNKLERAARDIGLEM